MLIRFCDHNQAVADAYKEVCGHLGEAYCLDIFTIPETDALVSPANSFGQMHGGIDYHYFKYFGFQIEDRVMATIAAKYAGELQVGEAFITETNDSKFPYLIVAPTMRTPQPIKETHDIFMAAKAAMSAAIEAGIESVCFPGMGTLTGEIDPHIAATRVKEGIESALS